MKLRTLMLTAGATACLVFAATLSLSGAASDAVAADKPDPYGFENAPPAVQSLDLTALPQGSSSEGNALLEVRYTQGQVLPATIELTKDERKVQLRSSEHDPMLYTAYIDFDFDELIKEQQRRQQLAQTIRSVPVFEGRELVANIGLSFLEPSDVQARVRSHQPIRIPWETIFDVPGQIRPEKSLLITDPTVVQDPTRTFDYCDKTGGPNGTGNPNGAWTFKTLMTNMSSHATDSVGAANFVQNWLGTYSDRTYAAQRVINHWPRIPGTGTLDLDKAPMRLLAIVNRMDIRNNASYGGRNAGEVRFVFGVLGNEGNTDSVAGIRSCRQLAFTVILEYGIPQHGCANIQAYAQQWKSLGNLSWGSGYNQALQNVTNVVTARYAAPLKINGSAINQVRSDEISLLHPLDAFPSIEPNPEDNKPWELREYHLDPTTLGLQKVNVALTPDRRVGHNLNNTTTLGTFINDNTNAILNNTYSVPALLNGQPFQALTSHNPHTHPNGVWKAPNIVNTQARHLFSLNTCNACHGSETQTSFLHIIPRDVDQPSDLSRFMIGDGSLENPGTYTVVDPVSGVQRQFGELHHRQQDLASLVNMSCAGPGFVIDLLGTNRIYIRSH